MLDGVFQKVSCVRAWVCSNLVKKRSGRPVVVRIITSSSPPAVYRMGAKFSVPGIASPVRVDIAACIWIAYIFAGIFAIQLLLCAWLTVRWKFFGGRNAFDADVDKGGARSLEMKTVAMA
jgi:hypothetical protein